MDNVTQTSVRTFTPSDMKHTVRKVVQITDTPLDVVEGRKIIRRVEKILMPNGRYRYPVTYIDRTPGGWSAHVVDESERLAKELDSNFRP